jgi:hypothetical protein
MSVIIIFFKRHPTYRKLDHLEQSCERKKYISFHWIFLLHSHSLSLVILVNLPQTQNKKTAYTLICLCTCGSLLTCSMGKLLIMLLFTLDSFQTNITMGQYYKTFYSGNLLSFRDNTIILCYKALLPW